MPTRTATRGPRQSADERRDQIVAAALDEFAARGLAGASTDAVARRAGVSQPYVFQLFRTKKELFLAVVRHAFVRTTRAFEAAAHRYRAGTVEGCDSILDALGLAYMDLLADRTLLLVQLQAYAAGSDPEVQEVVRREFGRLYRYVRDLSGESPEALHRFFAEGMLLNVGAAIGLPGSARTWSLESFGGEP
jgi:AcrR family transcriptional regulator